MLPDPSWSPPNSHHTRAPTSTASSPDRGSTAISINKENRPSTNPCNMFERRSITFREVLPFSTLAKRSRSAHTCRCKIPWSDRASCFIRKFFSLCMGPPNCPFEVPLMWYLPHLGSPPLPRNPPQRAGAPLASSTPAAPLTLKGPPDGSGQTSGRGPSRSTISASYFN